MIASGVRASGRAVGLLALVSLDAAAAAEAPGRPVAVTVIAGECPEASTLVAALRRALPAEVEVGMGPQPGARAVELEDQGPRYRVRVEGSEREFQDPARRCAERARTAAVFASLVLDTLEADLVLPSPPPPPPRIDPIPPPVPPAPAPPPPLPRWRRLGLRFLLSTSAEGALASTPAVAAGGGLRLGIVRGRFGGSFGVAGLSPVELRLSGQPVQLLRVPLDLSALWRWERGRLALSASLGLALDVVVATGLALPRNRQSAAIEGGVRAAAEVGVRAGPLWPFFALSAVWLPVPPSVKADPDRTLGGLPPWWFGASLGVTLPLGTPFP